ncbi:MAG: hypothetical protein C4329_00110 [Chitinophagaceae bacterium]
MRFGLACLLVLLIACKDGKKGDEGKDDNSDGFSYESFSNKFPKGSLPYSLTDTGLLRNTDTATLSSISSEHFIADSLLSKAFDKGARIKFTPLAKIEVPKKETYFIVKAISGSDRAAFMLVFNKDKKFSASFPFLIPDDDNTTSQTSSIDRSQTISRSTLKKSTDGTAKEGRNVFVYNSGINGFTLVLTDLLDDNAALINPIDTLKHTQKWTGDFTNGKDNLVSVRDGRSPKERMVFIHFEKEEGRCKGELKGNFLMTSSNTAVYRGGTDPCVLTLRFDGSQVSMHEENCGNHRDVKCMFEGSFTHKTVKTKSKPKKSASAEKKPATP